MSYTKADWRVGQRVLVQSSSHWGINTQPAPEWVTVTSVGRKWVYCGHQRFALTGEAERGGRRVFPRATQWEFWQRTRLLNREVKKLDGPFSERLCLQILTEQGVDIKFRVLAPVDTEES